MVRNTMGRMSLVEALLPAAFSSNNRRRDLEEALATGWASWRFRGLGLQDAVPDAATLSRFRVDLAEAALAETVFDAVNRQLEQRGLMVKADMMIDAPLFAAEVKPPSMREGEVSERDPPAGSTR